MKFNTSLLTLLTLEVTSAHYFFSAAIAGGVTNSKVVRTSTRATSYNPIKFSSNDPVDIRDGSFADGPDIRCNQGAFSSAGKTDVLTVAAGSTIGFKLFLGEMGHPGPGLVYMSRAPGDNVKTYDGSGDWFKIFQEGVCNTGDFTTTAWCAYNRNSITATIPKDTPSGEYLVRVEHIGIHKSFLNQPEHYVSCAQVKVTNGGTGTPGPLVKFPGAYKDSDAYAKFSIYNGAKTFPFPGPAVWSAGGSSAGTSPAQPATTVKPAATTSVKPAATTSVKPSATTSAATKPAVPTTTAVKPVGTSVKPSAATSCDSKPTTEAAPAAAGAPLYGQCGGAGFAARACAQGKCTVSNAWYSQCL